MKFLNAIIYSILICNIFSDLLNVDSCETDQYHIIDYSQTDRVLELDWTDDDEYTLKVNFYNEIGTISGFFVNASVSEDVDEQTYDSSIVKQKDSEGYNLFNLFEINASGNLISTTITPSIISANKEVITEKFYKYFGWIECSGSKTARLRKSEILVIVNNGKLYQISKYLLFVMALLLL